MEVPSRSSAFTEAKRLDLLHELFDDCIGEALKQAAPRKCHPAGGRRQQHNSAVAGFLWLENSQD